MAEGRVRATPRSGIIAYCSALTPALSRRERGIFRLPLGEGGRRPGEGDATKGLVADCTALTPTLSRREREDTK
ncbi:hypothetical protein GMPD_06200 [Geomonas paludis]|uniref:Uncharacterized protein n=1 Tax=Geomonas paludis TaxID=2740185 RepID=A0A6V8MRS4_9BACT|nr:hypothetical protein GMPD_06200 [Geomonas paludis]